MPSSVQPVFLYFFLSTQPFLLTLGSHKHIDILSSFLKEVQVQTNPSITLVWAAIVVMWSYGLEPLIQLQLCIYETLLHWLKGDAIKQQSNLSPLFCISIIKPQRIKSPEIDLYSRCRKNESDIVSFGKNVSAPIGIIRQMKTKPQQLSLSSCISAMTDSL